MVQVDDPAMDSERRPADDLLDVVRALLLLQGAILVATTIEATIWGQLFHGGGAPALMSGASAAVLLIGRARLRVDRRRTRRLVYGVEGLILLAFAIDLALSLALAHAHPPIVALLTQLVLPSSVVTLLRRSARAGTAVRSVAMAEAG